MKKFLSKNTIKKLMFLAVILVSFIALQKAGICSIADKEANKLFAETVQLIKKAEEAENASYIDALKLYEEALIKLERITSEYPSSRLAIEIDQEKVVIGDYGIGEFKEIIVSRAEKKAEAEGNILCCVLLLTEKPETYHLTKAPILCEIAGKCAKIGQQKRTLEILSQALEIVQESGLYRFSLATIAIKYAEIGQYSQALKLAQKIKDDDDKACALAEIAGKYAETGQKDKALETLSEALKIANNISILVESSLYKKARTFTEIAGKYSDIGQKDKALETLSEALKMTDLTASTLLMKNVKMGPYWKGKAMAQIAVKYTGVGQKDKAWEILTQAIKIAETIEDPDDRAYVLSWIAAKYAEVGQYHQSLKLTDTIEKPDDKVDALVAIASKYSETGAKDKTLEILSRSLNIIKTTKGSDTDPFQMFKIVTAFADSGQCDKAFELAKTIESPMYKDYAFSGLAGKYAKVERYNDAFKLVQAMADPLFKALALTDIAAAYTKTGHKVDNKTKNILHEIIRELGE